VAATGLAIMTVGAFTNSAVLAVLVRARRQFGSSVHTLITNQCAIDLYTSVSGSVSLILVVAHGYHYRTILSLLLQLHSVSASVVVFGFGLVLQKWFWFTSSLIG